MNNNKQDLLLVYTIIGITIILTIIHLVAHS